MTIEAPRIGALLASRKDPERHLMAHQPRCPATQSEAAREVSFFKSLPHGGPGLVITTHAVKKFRSPAARHCTFVFAPPKTQTQPPKPPRPSLQLLFRGLRLRFRVHNHRPRRRKVGACFVDPPPPILPESNISRSESGSDSDNLFEARAPPHKSKRALTATKFFPVSTKSTEGHRPPARPPAIALGFSGVAFAFSPHPARHFRGVH